jgi:K+-transporting ATPase KdpF subunit
MIGLSMILGVCGLIGTALLVYLFYRLFRGDKL